MDAFAVSVCKGLAMKKVTLKSACIVGLWFGAFQALMPMAGYFLCSRFSGLVDMFAHWIAFALLVLIGANMIREALLKAEIDGEASSASLSFNVMLVLAVATSIDAMAIGVSFAFLNVDIIQAACIIGVTTFLISAAGMKAGSVFGGKYEKKAEFAGGLILMLLGLKILLQHLGLL